MNRDDEKVVMRWVVMNRDDERVVQPTCTSGMIKSGSYLAIAAFRRESQMKRKRKSNASCRGVGQSAFPAQGVCAPPSGEASNAGSANEGSLGAGRRQTRGRLCGLESCGRYVVPEEPIAQDVPQPVRQHQLDEFTHALGLHHAHRSRER